VTNAASIPSSPMKDIVIKSYIYFVGEVIRITSLCRGVNR
jgi:hypothetical protein